MVGRLLKDERGRLHHKLKVLGFESQRSLQLLFLLWAEGTLILHVHACANIVGESHKAIHQYIISKQRAP